ncbi:hypothetical protein GCM10010521_16110 [Streptomyces rameus]|uniref:Lipoprotein n=1 Tax=Streptomyces rameus TaxID=68261 RepID=A0ABP6MYV3_9ACTN
MEVLGNVLMMSRPRWLLGCALVPALFLTACTSDHDSTPDQKASPSAAHWSSEAQTEKKLATQVQSALDAVTSRGSSMVESGVERVSDGVHTQPDLGTGAIYKVTVACAGKGSAEIAFTPPGVGSKKPVPCDGSVVFERFTARDSLRLDVRGNPGSKGMIAWRINKV